MSGAVEKTITLSSKIKLQIPDIPSKLWHRHINSDPQSRVKGKLNQLEPVWIRNTSDGRLGG